MGILVSPVNSAEDRDFGDNESDYERVLIKGDQERELITAMTTGRCHEFDSLLIKIQRKR